MSAILRKRVRSHFVQVPNSTARDSRLSFKAVGVLTHILSLPDGAQISAESLAETHTDGKEAVRTALQELTKAGYYRIDRRRSSAGTFIMEVVVSNRPDLDEPDDEEHSPASDYPTPVDPTPEKPTSEKPGSGEPTPDNPPPSTKYPSTKKNHKDLSTKKENKERGQLFEPVPTPSSADLPQFVTGFDAFWDRWPEHLRMAIDDARRQWKYARNRVSETDMLIGVDRWAKYWADAGIEPQFVPYPGKWLERGQYRDTPPAIPSPKEHVETYR